MLNFSFSLTDIQNQIAFALAILVPVATIWVWAFKKKPIEISYAARQRELIGKQRRTDIPQELVMTYKGIAIDSLFRYRYVFWNSGSTAIRGSDLKTPIQLLFPQAFEVRVQESTLRENAVVTDMPHQGAAQDQPIEISFDFLDPEHGFVIDVFGDTDFQPPHPVGVIVGANASIKLGKFDDEDLSPIENRVMQAFMFSLLVSILVLIFGSPSIIFIYMISLMSFITLYMLVKMTTFAFTAPFGLRHPYPPKRLMRKSGP